MGRRIFILIALGFSFAFGNSAAAAEFARQEANHFGPVSIVLKGQIKPGDFDRFKDFLLLPGNLKAYTNYLWLDSIGGNLAEAMKFAVLFEKNSASVVVGPDGKCYSACFMMFASGVDRWLYPFGELGVHRVSVQFPASLTGLDKAARNGMVQAVTNNAAAYLTAQGMPASLVAKMQDTPASEMFIINTLMIKREGWQRIMALQPKFLEAVEQACGKQPDPATAPWTACKIDFQTRRARRFVTDELALLEAGQASVLFAPSKGVQAQVAVDGLK